MQFWGQESNKYFLWKSTSTVVTVLLFCIAYLVTRSQSLNGYFIEQIWQIKLFIAILLSYILLWPCIFIYYRISFSRNWETVFDLWIEETSSKFYA